LRHSHLSTYYFLLLTIKNIRMLKTVRMIANIAINVASGPAPTTIGKGPIIITPPKFTDPPEKTTANSKSVIPMISKREPRKNRVKT